MTAINLKGDFWIRGFDTNEEVYNFKDSICFLGEPVPYIYIGKTSEISEEMAKRCVEIHPNIGFKNYNVPSHIKIKDWTSNWDKFTAKESIQSACDKEYCIIYKTK